jgi:hypothetical protein
MRTRPSCARRATRRSGPRAGRPFTGTPPLQRRAPTLRPPAGALGQPPSKPTHAVAHLLPLRPGPGAGASPEQLDSRERALGPPGPPPPPAPPTPPRPPLTRSLPTQVSDKNGGTSFCDPCRGKVAVLHGLQFVPCRPLPAPSLKALPEVRRRPGTQPGLLRSHSRLPPRSARPAGATFRHARCVRRPRWTSPARRCRRAPAHGCPGCSGRAACHRWTRGRCRSAGTPATRGQCRQQRQQQQQQQQRSRATARTTRAPGTSATPRRTPRTTARRGTRTG